LTLATVAGRLAPLLGGVALPLHVAGVLVTRGTGRWLLLGITLILSVALVRPIRPTTRRDAPVTLVASVAVMVAWVYAAPTHPVMLGALLAVTMVYTGLMVPRPYADFGIGGVALAYVGSAFVIGTGGAFTVEVAGVAATDTTLGVLMLAVRITTERGMNERTLALAAANEKLEQLSLTDPLTGLANRRRLANAFAVMWQHAEATGRPVSVIMVDIDYFKQYNDHFGHPGGDGCLQRLATVLTASTRRVDIVARCGGEEFAVVLPDTDLGPAYHVAERIRHAVAQLRQEHPGSPIGCVTVSAGVASAVPGSGRNQEDLLRLADEGLYSAKRGGRNQVVPCSADGPMTGMPTDQIATPQPTSP
jgi:diguanylate cyclase (GGDEF)-like protein